MSSLRRPLCVGLLIAIVTVACGFLFIARGTTQGGKMAKAEPAWAWLGDKPLPNQTVYSRKEIVLKHRITSARLFGTCDNQMTVYVNGKEVVASDNWEAPVFREVNEVIAS